MKRLYQITEYGSFLREREFPDCVSLPGNVFDTLEKFVLSNYSDESDGAAIMEISAKGGVGKVITTKNYVGLIAMADGTNIEILPKICSEKQYSADMVKQLLVDMLKSLSNAPFKSMQLSTVRVDQMDIFEIFIRMFLDEVFCIIKYGIQGGYETIESNETVFKGKIVFDSQIRKNCLHKEKCYVRYDVHDVNRAENRLLKATLQYLYKETKTSKNKNDIRTLLGCFSEVEASVDFKEDFLRVSLDRSMNKYKTALVWSKVFLMGNSFSAFSGSNIAFSLLFPMETLFESYIALKLRRHLRNRNYTCIVQDSTHYLFDEPKRRFLIKPDIVLRNEIGEIYILDTKWKILSNSKKNYGISQADMYQMYTYQKKYGAKSITLIYPKTDKINSVSSVTYHSKDGVTVYVNFIDLFDVENSLSHLDLFY